MNGQHHQDTMREFKVGLKATAEKRVLTITFTRHK
jgi:hypothetical protein